MITSGESVITATGSDMGEYLYAIALTLFLGWLILARLPRFSGEEFRETARQAGAWIGIFFVITLAYAYRFELAGVKDRVLATLIPGHEIRIGDRSLSVPVSADGHFYLKARINGVPVRFLVDTGATDIVLSPRDARRIGLDTDRLSHNQIYHTANGIGRGARIRLDRLETGDLVMEDIPAGVNQADMGTSLLGMRFFHRLRSYEVSGGMLRIHW